MLHGAGLVAGRPDSRVRAGSGAVRAAADRPGRPDRASVPAVSRYLKKERIGEAEENNLQKTVPGRIQSIVNIHNPSIEVHVVDPGNNTGAAVIVVPGGGHRTLNVGTEGADIVPFFYNYGVATVILRNRLRQDGYVAETDAVYDAQQAVRIVRARAKEWNIDPQKIGMMGFSAGAELVAPAALFFDEVRRREQDGRRRRGGRELAAGFRRADLSRADAVRPRAEA